MQNTLTLGLIQTDLVWENPKENCTFFEAEIDVLFSTHAHVDLIILPEMFTTGFSMRANILAEKERGETLGWMQQIALKYKTAITGSFIVEENNKYYNRLYFVFPDGTFQSYDKRHTFTLAGEDKVFTKGDKRLIVSYKGWKICPLICYDLRFPVWSRNNTDYDVLVYVANWPVSRINAWDALLRARAIENMSYCIGVNRIGLDGNNIMYPGHSSAYNVLGEKLFFSTKKESGVVILEKNHVQTLRAKLGFLNDRDSFTIL
jgi:predicted amidohydrolase